MEADKIAKQMEGQGKAEAMPKGSKKLDAEAPEVKKKDAAQYKEVENMKKQAGA